MRRAWILVWLAVASLATAQWNASALGSFGLATLPDAAAGDRLAARFRAHGRPVFLIGNLSLGLQPGDIMRFPDRAVLIDGDVWQTLKSEGALAGLRVAPVVRVKARAAKDAWSARSKVVKGDERKAYELGERLLRSMDGVMPMLPDGQKLSLSFEAGQMVLMVPPGFLEKFRLPRGEGDQAKTPETVAARLPQGAPRIVFALPNSVLVGKPLRLEAWALDDSGGPTNDIQLSCLGPIPPGLTWNPTTRVLQGTPSVAGSSRLVLRAQGPGGLDSLAFDLVVRRNHPPFFQNAPESAYPGMAWSFRPAPGDSDHPLSALRIVPRSLPPKARWDSLTGTVWWTPPEDSMPTDRILTLVATDPTGDSTAASWTIPVASSRDGAPRFLSELGLGAARVDAPLTYLPVAISPQGGPLRLQAVLPQGSAVTWDGTHLALLTARPGIYMAEIVATDSSGRESRQMVAWDVKPAHRTTVFLETRYQRDLAPWQVGIDFGTGRVGMFTPSLGRLFGWSDPVDQEWPYLFLGANLLDEAARSRGNRLTADLGLTLRIPKNNLYTGGFYGRVEGCLQAPGGIPLETRFDVQGWIRQAVMVADSNVLTTVALTQAQQNQFKVNDPRWTASKMLTVRDAYWGAVQKTLDQARADDNVVLLSNLWGWTPVGAGLKAGLGVWRLDQPLAGISHQSLGAGLKGDWSASRLRFEPSVQAGWGPQGAGFTAWGGLLVSLDASRGRR